MSTWPQLIIIIKNQLPLYSVIKNQSQLLTVLQNISITFAVFHKGSVAMVYKFSTATSFYIKNITTHLLLQTFELMDYCCQVWVQLHIKNFDYNCSVKKSITLYKLYTYNN